MKIPATALAFSLLLLPASQAVCQSKNIHESVDPYTALRTLFLEVQTRACPDDPPEREHDAEVHLLFSAVEGKDHTVSYFLTPELDHGSSLSVRTAGTMDTLINGNAGRLVTPVGSTVTTAYDANRSYIHETVPFLIQPDDLSALTNADWFQFRVNGPRQSVQRCTDAKRLHDLAEFIAAASQYGPPAGAVSDSIVPAKPNRRASREEAVAVGQLKTLSLDSIDTFACASGTASNPDDTLVHLTITAEEHADHTVKYFIVTDLKENAPLNLHSKDTLETKMDGLDQVFHTPHGSIVKIEKGSNGQPVVHETIAFHVDRRDLIALGKSSVFELQIDAAGQPVRRCTDAKHLQDLGDFINNTATLYDHPVALASASPTH